MQRHFAIALACLALAPVRAWAQDDKPTFSIARIVSSIQEGQTWANVNFSLGCISPLEKLAWGVGHGKLNVAGFKAPAVNELKKLGFAVSGDPSDPFSENKAGDWALGGTITAAHGTFCIGGNVFDADAVKGEASIEIDWQLYSTAEKRVVAKSHTVGSGKIDVSARGGFETVLIAALDDSLLKFVQQEDFKRSTSASRQVGSATTSTQQTKLTLVGATRAQPTKISDAIGSVVLVQAGGGHGSGFLVSSDGYLMTAEHVVGSDKYVKIRWSDGLEGLGEVVRADKRRDVALIKTDPRGRQPLALHRAAPEPGDTVFAIGAPLDVNNQSTVTRGVASANRIMDGFSFIQSDVTVNGGNSGGPLLDEKGEVLGITDLSFRKRGNVPTGINYFVPIDDALRFLAAEPQ